MAYKKLPPVFRKAYTEAQFKKKISSRLFIPADKAFVESIFKRNEGKKPVAVPRDAVFSRSDIARLKSIAAQIKRQKGRVRLVPLAAACVFIGGVVFFVSAFKNPAAKMVLRNAFEGVFGAKCDITRVNIKIFGASVEIDNLAVANKNDTMRNLFEMERIAFDFDLTNILRGKFVTSLIEVSGVQANTGRVKDGALPPKKKKVTQEAKPNPVAHKAKEFSEGAKKRALGSVENIFASYNPENIMHSLFNQLKSPNEAERIKTELEKIIPPWQETPDRVKSSVDALVKSGEAVVNINIDSVKSDPARIAQLINDINALINRTKDIREETGAVIVKLSSDAKAVSALAAEAKGAIDFDMKLINGEINKIKSFNSGNAKNLLTGSFVTVLASAIGSYYPYAVEGYALAEKYLLNEAWKQNPAQKKAEKGVQNKRRSEGRTVEYRGSMPKFLIKKIKSSGKTGDFSIEAQLNDLCSDMDMWGKPVSLEVVSRHGAMKENARAKLDVRKARTEPLLALVFEGSGYDLNLGFTENVPGFPSIKGTALFGASLNFDKVDDFEISGNVFIDKAQVRAAEFEPLFAYEIYSNILASFEYLEAEFSAGYSPNAGINASINSAVDEIFKDALQREVNAKLSALKDNILKEAKTELDKAAGGLSEQFADFSDIQKTISGENEKLSSYQKLLETKIEELKKSARSKTEDAVRDAASNALQNLFPGKR